MATWLITGCSTGLGRALASTALDRSHPGTALALSLDVMDHAQRRDVVRGALDRFGAIDVLVNNAGHGYRTAVEEAAVEQVQEFFVPRRREATQRGRRRLGADQPEHQLPRLKNETE
jgi:NAD(P)-dependent dehydrogenase (short-subunit alcohol dehydrogenase family)